MAQLNTKLSKKENMPIGLDNLVLSGCYLEYS